MSDEILVNVTPRETRVAIIENGLLQEVHIERSSRCGLVGNIYLGCIKRVLPGIQAAFVDIGLERTAFLHATDIQQQDGADDGDTGDGDTDVSIVDMVSEGQELLVQVIKDPLGTKGARLTTQISLPSRFLVMMPKAGVIGVSQRIDDEDERQRLKSLLETVTMSGEEAGGKLAEGYIIRTAAEGCGGDELQDDAIFLRKLWQTVRETVQTSAAPQCVHAALPLEMRILRDIPSGSIEKIRVDSRETSQRLMEFVRQFIPELAGRIEHYPGERPIFDLYSVDDEIQKSLQRNVQLKSGGHLCIDQTEAMTTVDVNTGAYVGHRNLEETIFKTNLEATQAIARQLRLRNLGGIIIIDFIDMHDEEHKQQVLRSLEKNFASDRAKRSISEVSDLGLVEMTRERTRESLEHILCETCPACEGRGSVKTRATTCYEIFRELMREARQYESSQFLVLASGDVIDMLLEEEADSLAELELFIKKTVKLQVEPMYTQEQFDVVMM